MMKQINIHNNIRMLRKLNNMSQMLLAEKISEVTKRNYIFQQIGNYERQASEPNLETITALALVFNVTVDELLFNKI